MFARRYFAGRYFAPRYFPDGGTGVVVVVPPVGCVHGMDRARYDLIGSDRSRYELSISDELVSAVVGNDEGC